MAPVVARYTHTSPTTLHIECGVVVPTPTTLRGDFAMFVLSTVEVSLVVGAMANLIAPCTMQCRVCSRSNDVCGCIFKLSVLAVRGAN